MSPPRSERIRAVGVRAFGGPDRLEVVEVPRPIPGPGQVRIKVEAATVNPADVLFRQGALAAALADAEPPFVAGLELAGTIDVTGAGSTWRPGERVAAITHFAPEGRGAHAEEVVVADESVMTCPSGLLSVEAATVPMNGLTARLALDTLGLNPASTLAVTGAAGALGGYVVQLARSDGVATVIGVVDPDDESLVRRLGCDLVVHRGRDAAAGVRAACPAGVDGLVDAALVGAPMLPAVTDGGAFVAVRRPGPESERQITVTEVSVRTYERNAEALRGLARLVGAGVLTPRVASVYPPNRAAEAHRRLERGGTRGRLVLDLS